MLGFGSTAEIPFGGLVQKSLLYTAGATIMITEGADKAWPIHIIIDGTQTHRRTTFAAAINGFR